jgi:ketosteroid isomerase-like protein
MKKLTLTAAAFAAAVACMPLSSLAAGTPLTTIHQAAMDFNSGNYAAWSGACAGSAIVTDDFAPYTWSGPNACNAWLAAFRVQMKMQKIDNVTVVFGAPMHMMVSGNLAYIVLPATLHFNQNGKPVRMTGNVMTIVLRKGMAGDWRMTAWTWADGK